MRAVYVKSCHYYKSCTTLISVIQSSEEVALGISDFPSAWRASSRKGGIQRSSLFRRAMSSRATATVDGGIPANCATLSPWLSLFTPGRRRCEYVKEPN